MGEGHTELLLRSILDRQSEHGMRLGRLEDRVHRIETSGTSIEPSRRPGLMDTLAPMVERATAALPIVWHCILWLTPKVIVGAGFILGWWADALIWVSTVFRAGP